MARVDRLGVRSSCDAVVRSSVSVGIDDAAVQKLAAEMLARDATPEWDANLHYRATGPDGDERTAMWLLVLDTLNFCFWGQGDDLDQRWRLRWRGGLVDGYSALVAALTLAVEHGYPLHDPHWLAEVSAADIAAILTPEPGHTEIPLLAQRVSNVRELGRGLLSFGPNPATTFVTTANHSAVALVERIVASFPSFNDVAIWPFADTGLPHREVRFFKRAQILVADLAGGLQGSSLAEFTDLDQLTAFADYKVPQILRSLGVLAYDDELARLVDSRVRIPAGSQMEIEIRAATVIACDRIVVAMRAAGRRITAAQLDWLLWSRSQSLSSRQTPYHLTETIYY